MQILKAPANEETLLRKQCFLAAQTGKHLLKKQNVSQKSQKHFFLFLGSKKMFPQQMFPLRANGETFRETTMFPQRFLVCGGLKGPTILLLRGEGGVG